MSNERSVGGGGAAIPYTHEGVSRQTDQIGFAGAASSSRFAESNDEMSVWKTRFWFLKLVRF